MKYLQLEAKRIMTDMGYECSEKDIIKLANMFEERYDEGVCSIFKGKLS